jgi:RHS repeat-associated protein
LGRVAADRSPYASRLGRWLAPDPLLSILTAASVDIAPSSAAISNLYRYALNNPLNLWDPTGLDTVVVITRDYIIGSHAALYVDNAGTPIQFDPGGSYRSGDRGSSGSFEGEEANLEAYMKYQRGTGSTVATYRFKTTPEDESALVERISPSDGSPGEGEGGSFTCAYHVSSVLQGVGPFKDLGISVIPGNLARFLDQILNPRPRPQPPGDYWGFMLERMTD